MNNGMYINYEWRMSDRWILVDSVCAIERFELHVLVHDDDDGGSVVSEP